jgi:peroxiredoxin
LRDVIDFHGGGVQLLAVDPHEKWSAQYLLKDVGLETDDLRFPLLLDPTQTVSATYGVAFQMRVHVEESNRPATFIIDKQGVLRYAKRGETYGDRPNQHVIREQLEMLK